MKVARRLLVIYQMVDGGIGSADGARVTMLYWHRTKLHGLSIKGEQTVRQQFTNTRKVLQRLSCLNRTQHTSNSAQHTRLRTSRYGTHGRRFLKHTTVAGCTRQMGKRLPVETQDASMREGLACHHTRIVDKELHGEVICTIDDEVVFFNDIECITPTSLVK